MDICSSQLFNATIESGAFDLEHSKSF